MEEKMFVPPSERDFEALETIDLNPCDGRLDEFHFRRITFEQINKLKGFIASLAVQFNDLKKELAKLSANKPVDTKPNKEKGK